MFDKFNFNINEQKHKKQEITSISQETFDLFDDATSKAFDDLTKKVQDNSEKQCELQKKISNYTEGNDGRPTCEDIEIYDEIMDLASDEYWSSEHLYALSEMKIVYLFKSVEITMKSLIHTAYPKINTKDFFQWESMASYFKSINIKLSDFDGYIEVTELRKVNNSIKHNNTINEDINKIKEFTSETHFTYSNILNFHKRIKPKIQNFVKRLGQEIINNLYVFDDSRLEKISDDYKTRMDDNDLKKLAAKLTNGQKPKE